MNVFCFVVADIQRYMDPAYTDEMTMSDSARADTIIAGTKPYMRRHRALISRKNPLHVHFSSFNLPKLKFRIGLKIHFQI